MVLSSLLVPQRNLSSLDYISDKCQHQSLGWKCYLLLLYTHVFQELSKSLYSWSICKVAHFAQSISNFIIEALHMEACLDLCQAKKLASRFANLTRRLYMLEVSNRHCRSPGSAVHLTCRSDVLKKFLTLHDNRKSWICQIRQVAFRYQKICSRATPSVFELAQDPSLSYTWGNRCGHTGLNWWHSHWLCSSPHLVGINVFWLIVIMRWNWKWNQYAALFQQRQISWPLSCPNSLSNLLAINHLNQTWGRPLSYVFKFV